MVKSIYLDLGSLLREAVTTIYRLAFRWLERHARHITALSTSSLEHLPIASTTVIVALRTVL